MFKNVADQKYRVFAFNRTSGTPVEGDAANITMKISKDYGTATASDDTNPTETEDGYYLFDLTQEETNCDDFASYPESSTGDVQVIGIPPTVRPVLDDARGFLVNLTIKYADNSVVPYCGVVITLSDTSSTASVYRSGRADELGKIDLHLPEGTYYLWRRKPGSTFSDPATVIIDSLGGVTVS